MVLGHLGMAIVMAGATVASNYGMERDVRMTLGDTAAVGDYQVVFVEMGNRRGANFTAEYGRFEILDSDGQLVSVQFPEKRQYLVQRSVMTEAAIDAGLFRDIFIAIGERVSDDAWAIRVQYKPLVRWLWLGAIFMAVGGFMAISDRRYRLRETVQKSVEPPAARDSEQTPGKPAGATS
jgi:cytochrome c-type biogenesis protein CcmF